MRNKEKIKQSKRERRHSRIRKKIFGTSQKPRLSVYRSLKHIYAQLIDDNKKKTIVSASDFKLDKKALPEKTGKEQKSAVSKNMARAYAVGKLLAQESHKKNIKRAVFDRGGFAYHGIIKALAEGAREGGLEL